MFSFGAISFLWKFISPKAWKYIAIVLTIGAFGFAIFKLGINYNEKKHLQAIVNAQIEEVIEAEKFQRKLNGIQFEAAQTRRELTSQLEQDKKRIRFKSTNFSLPEPIKVGPSTREAVRILHERMNK